MRKLVIFVLVAFLSLFMARPSSAKQDKTGRTAKDTLIDERFGYELKVLSNWNIKLEKEPSLVRSTMTKKNYLAAKATTIMQEDQIIPTIVICADTTSLSLPAIENSLINGKGVFPDKEEYLMRLDALASYQLIKSGDITLDSLAGKLYGFKKRFLKQVIDPSQRYGPEGNPQVARESYLLGEVILLKKGNNLYIIQFTGENEDFAGNEEEFSKMLQTWKFVK